MDTLVENPEIAQEDIEEDKESVIEDDYILNETSNLLVKDYINAQGIWEFSVNVPNFSYLGDVIEAILHAYFRPAPRNPFPTGPHYFPLKICIQGPLFSGRHTHAKYFESEYGLKFFEIDKILEDRNKVLEKKQELEEGKKPKKIQDDESEIFMEESVNCIGDTSKDKARLFRAKLRGLFGDENKVEEETKKVGKKEEIKCQGWGVIGYPRTMQEAEDLELELSGYIHPKHLPPNVSDIKKHEATIIATPSGLTTRSVVLTKSVFDIIIKLEVPGPVLVKRAVDRRIDTTGNIYNLTFNPPPDHLLPKLKTIEHPNEEEILKSLEDYNLEKNQLQNWFQNFGVDEWPSFIDISDTKLDIIKETIKKKTQEWLKIREDIANTPKTNDIKLEFHDKVSILTVKEARSLYKQWKVLKDTYLKDLSQCLDEIQCIDERLNETNNLLLSNFEEYLCRPDNKQSILNPCIDKLKGLLESGAIISSATRKSMLDELDDLSDLLWDVIEYRKDENLVYYTKLRQEDPCITLINSIIECASRVIQVEINKLVHSINLILDFHSKFFKDSADPDNPLSGIEFAIEDLSGTDKLNYILNKSKEFINSLPDIACKSQASEQYLLRIQQIEVWVFKMIKKVNDTSDNTFELMDKWIGYAVMAENQFVNQIINAWKEAVKVRVNFETFPIQDNSNISNFLKKQT